MLCSAVTRKGRKCKLEALASGLCSVHDPALRCNHPLPKNRVCKIPTGGGWCEYHQSGDRGKSYKVHIRRQAQKRDGEFYCRTCARSLPHEEFWDSKKRKYGLTCARCLSSRRVKARIRKGKRVHYTAYIKSTAWAEKRIDYWRNGKYRDGCYMCGKARFPGMELHHRTYARLGRESLDDLVPLCPEHHELVTRAWNIVKDTGISTLWEVTTGICEAFRKREDLPLHEREYEEVAV